MAKYFTTNRIYCGLNEIVKIETDLKFDSPNKILITNPVKKCPQSFTANSQHNYKSESCLKAVLKKAKALNKCLRNPACS